jgi:hypothetical protein
LSHYIGNVREREGKKAMITLEKSAMKNMDQASKEAVELLLKKLNERLSDSEKMESTINQVGVEVSQQVWDRLQDQAWWQVEEQVLEEVREPVCKQVGEQVFEEVWYEVGEQVGWQVLKPVLDQIGVQVWVQVEEEIFKKYLTMYCLR